MGGRRTWEPMQVDYKIPDISLSIGARRSFLVATNKIRKYILTLTRYFVNNVDSVKIIRCDQLSGSFNVNILSSSIRRILSAHGQHSHHSPVALLRFGTLLGAP